MQPRRRSAETKSAPGIFHIMMLAITGQWVAEVTVVLCLFGAGCIGVAITGGDAGDRAANSGAKRH
jgi:hypothetical protein